MFLEISSNEHIGVLKWEWPITIGFDTKMVIHDDWISHGGLKEGGMNVVHVAVLQHHLSGRRGAKS